MTQKKPIINSPFSIKQIDQNRYQVSDFLEVGKNTYNIIHNEQKEKSNHLVCKLITQLVDHEELFQQTITCKHIVHPIGFIYFPDSKQIGIVRHKLQTSLNQFINKKRSGLKYLNPQEMKKIVVQLMEGISSLNGTQRGHGNLKLENIMLTERLDLYMVDLDVQIKQWSQAQHIQDMRKCGLILFSLSTLKNSNQVKESVTLQTKNISEAFLQIRQIYGKEFIQFVQALMGDSLHQKTFEQIHDDEYQTYVYSAHHHVQHQTLHLIEREQNFFLSIVSQIKNQMNGQGYNQDDYFSFLSHSNKNSQSIIYKREYGNKIDLLFTRLETPISDTDSILLNKYLVSAYDFNIDVAPFLIQVLEKKINIALDDDLDFESEQIENESKDKSILQSQVHWTLSGNIQIDSTDFSNQFNKFTKIYLYLDQHLQFNSRKTLQKHRKSQLSCKNQGLQKHNCQKIFHFRQQDYKFRSDKICTLIKEHFEQTKVSNSELNRLFQQYDVHRDNFVGDFVFMFIIKKYLPQISKEDLDPVIQSFKSSHTQKKSKQVFFNYVLFLVRVGNNNVEEKQNQGLFDCTILLKKIHHVLIHYCINLQGTFWQVDHDRTGTISFDGWIYLMGQLFVGILSNHDMTELFEYYDEDQDQIINYTVFLKDVFDRPDVFKQIRQKLIAVLQEKNETVEEYFQEMDEDNDAFLDVMEFEAHIKKIFPNIDHDDMIEVFDRFDLNRSGQISILEFQTAIVNYDEQSASYQSMQNNIIIKEEELEVIKDNLMGTSISEPDQEQDNVLELDIALEQKIDNFKLFQNSNFIDINVENISYSISLLDFERMVLDPQILNRSSQYQLNIKNINRLFIESHERVLTSSDRSHMNHQDDDVKGIRRQVSIYNQGDQSFERGEQQNSEQPQQIRLPQSKVGKPPLVATKRNNDSHDDKMKSLKTKQQLLQLIKQGCLDKNLNSFHVFTQYESDEDDFQIDNVIDLQMTLYHIGIKGTDIDLQFLFEEFSNKITKNFSIMRICVELFDNFSKLIGMAINYIIRKDNMIPEIFYDEVVGDKFFFDLDCLRLINTEFQWELQDDLLNEVYDSWTHDQTIKLNKKKFFSLINQNWRKNDSKKDQHEEQLQNLKQSHKGFKSN